MLLLLTMMEKRCIWNVGLITGPSDNPGLSSLYYRENWDAFALRPASESLQVVFDHLISLSGWRNVTIHSPYISSLRQAVPALLLFPSLLLMHSGTLLILRTRGGHMTHQLVPKQ